MTDYAVEGLTARAIGPMFKDDLKPASVSRRTKKVTKAALLKKAYDQVDARDGKKCQVTGRKLVADHDDESKRLTRDHLAPRSTAPERVDDVENILTVSWEAHKQLQRCRLIPVDKNGIETTRVSQIAGYVWNRARVPVGSEQFRLGKKEWKATK